MTIQGTKVPRDPRRAASPGRNGYRYRQQFGVIVICTDECHQARTFAKLKRAGYRLRVVTV